jgi:hypothetical protein
VFSNSVKNFGRSSKVFPNCFEKFGMTRSMTGTLFFLWAGSWALLRCGMISGWRGERWEIMLRDVGGCEALLGGLLEGEYRGREK